MRQARFWKLFDRLKSEGIIPQNSKSAIYKMFFMLGEDSICPQTKFRKMKKLHLAMLALVASFTVQAQTVFTVLQNTPYQLQYDHGGIYPSRIYVNGIQAKEFQISNLIISTNTIGTTNAYTFTVTMPGLDRGQYTLAATVFDPNIGIESDFSNVLNVKVKPRAPSLLRLLGF